MQDIVEKKEVNQNIHKKDNLKLKAEYKLMMRNDGVSIGLDFDYSKKFTKRYPSYMRKNVNESNETSNDVKIE